MQILEAEYEIVTPMFIGGADQHEQPELRPPSIKGALRFWWRAFYWAECVQQNPVNRDAALNCLHQQEAELFGAAAKDERYGQGKVALKVVTENHEPLKYNNVPLQRPSSGQTYLLGQGLYHFRDGFIRPALSSGQRFKVILKLHDSVDSALLGNTLLILGLLGGLGSRARKGWGSLAIRSLSHTDRQQETKRLFVPDDVDSYKAALTKLLTNVPSSVPPFTAFSKHSRIEISAKDDNPERLLNIIGDEMQLYRSYGRKVGGVHKVNSRVAEQNFTGDHDLIYSDFAHSNRTVSQHPRRLIFGLPHNYFFSDNTKVDVEAATFSRRASPLFIHAHSFTTGDCIGVQSLMKADFLPAGESILMKSARREDSVTCSADWNVITDYLDRFSLQERIL